MQRYLTFAQYAQKLKIAVLLKHLGYEEKKIDNFFETDLGKRVDSWPQLMSALLRRYKKYITNIRRMPNGRVLARIKLYEFLQDIKSLNLLEKRRIGGYTVLSREEPHEKIPDRDHR